MMPKEKLGAPIPGHAVRAGPDGLAVGALQRHLGIPASTLSHHIQHLISGGLIKQERHSRTLICTAQYEHLHALVTMLTENCCEGVEIVPTALW